MGRIVLLIAAIVSSSASVVAEEPVPDQVIEVVGNPWNSLEVVRLVISLLTPAAMIYVGLWMDRRIKELEHRQWTNQKVIEKRLQVYEELTPQLNQLMCYFMRIGSWKEHPPTAIIDMKRGLDKTAYIYAPLFSPEFLTCYNDYMNVCFAMFRGAGKDAQLKAEAQHYRDAFCGDDDDAVATWDPRWDECFTGAEEASTREQVGQGYHALVTLIAAELGIGIENSTPKIAKEALN